MTLNLSLEEVRLCLESMMIGLEQEYFIFFSDHLLGTRKLCKLADKVDYKVLIDKLKSATAQEIFQLCSRMSSFQESELEPTEANLLEAGLLGKFLEFSPREQTENQAKHVVDIVKEHPWDIAIEKISGMFDNGGERGLKIVVHKIPGQTPVIANLETFRFKHS